MRLNFINLNRKMCLRAFKSLRTLNNKLDNNIIYYFETPPVILLQLFRFI